MAREFKKELSQYTEKELIEVDNPVKKAIYNTERDKPIKIMKYKDKIKCQYCGRHYTRSNKKRHFNTQFHQAYEKMNDKLRKFLLENNLNNKI